MSTIFWAGTHEGTGKKNISENVLSARVSLALSRFKVIRRETYGLVSIAHYNILDNADVVVIAIDNVRAGFGILCATEDEAKAQKMLGAAQYLLQTLDIQAVAEALKISDGPAKAA